MDPEEVKKLIDAATKSNNSNKIQFTARHLQWMMTTVAMVVSTVGLGGSIHTYSTSAETDVFVGGHMRPKIAKLEQQVKDLRRDTTDLKDATSETNVALIALSNDIRSVQDDTHEIKQSLQKLSKAPKRRR